MKNAIVTGANGFIGSALVRELIKHDVNVWALDRKDANSNIPLSTRVTFLPFELSQIQLIEQSIPKKKFDAFFHLAWAGSAGDSRYNTQLQLNNVQWTIDALRVSKALGCERFLSAGSIMENETLAAMSVWGNKPGLGYIYGAAKLATHVMCFAVAANIGMDIIWPKVTNAYGIGEFSPRLINSTLRKIIAGESPRFTSGTQNYDFIYIDDVARAFFLIAENGKPFTEYIIGSSHPRPLKEFLLELKGAIAPSLDFIFGDVPFTGINLDNDAFDCSKTEADTGFRAEISFSEGVILTRNWLEKELKTGA